MQRVSRVILSAIVCIILLILRGEDILQYIKYTDTQNSMM